MPAHPQDALAARLVRYESRSSILRGIVLACQNPTSTEDAVRGFLREVCLGKGWAVGLYYQVTEGFPDAISPTDLSHPDQPRNPHLVRALAERAPAAAGIGIRRLVLQSKTAQWLPDVTREPSFTASKQAIALGVRGLIAVPVLSGTRLRGILEFYGRDAQNPLQETLDFLTQMTGILGITIDFHELDRKVRRIRQENESLFEHVRDPIYIIDREGRVLFANEATARVLGHPAPEMRGLKLHDEHHRGHGGAPSNVEDCPVHGIPLRTGTPHRARISLARREGTNVEGEAFATPYDRGNGHRGLLVLLRL